MRPSDDLRRRGRAALLWLVLLSQPLAAQTLKIATLSPNGSSWMQAMRAGAALIEEETAGRVTFKFYPGGVMGNDQAVLRKVKAHQLQGAAVMSGAMVRYYGDLWLYTLPLTFRSYEEVDYVRTRLDAEMIEGLHAGGWKVFGLAEAGFAYPMSTAAVPSIDAARARKVWVPAGDQVATLALTSLGIKPIPLSLDDVLTGLQTGLVDTVAVPPIGALAFQWHTKLRFITDLPVMYTFGVLAVDRDAFEELSQEDQSVVSRIMGNVLAGINGSNRREDAAALQALRTQGLTMVEPTESERVRWREAGERALEMVLQRGMVSPARYQKLNRYLNEFRSGRGS